MSLILKKRVSRPREFETLMKDLISTEGVFETLAQVMMFAAVLGYRHGAHSDFTDSAEPISMQVFSNEGVSLMRALALARTGSPTTIKEDESSIDEVIEHFQSYANGGLRIIASNIDKDNMLGSIEKLVLPNDSESLLHDILNV